MEERRKTNAAESRSGDSGSAIKASPASVAMVVRTRSEQETMAVAKRLADVLRGGDLVALDGSLGSGKTCFVRGLAQGLGIDPADVSSPTFLIRQEYAGVDGRTLIHIDGYRVSGPEELETIGWEELLESRESIMAVEWPSRLDDALADRVTVAISFEHCSMSKRELTFFISEREQERFQKVIGDGTTE